MIHMGDLDYYRKYRDIHQSYHMLTPVCQRHASLWLDSGLNSRLHRWHSNTPWPDRDGLGTRLLENVLSVLELWRPVSSVLPFSVSTFSVRNILPFVRLSRDEYRRTVDIRLFWIALAWSSSKRFNSMSLFMCCLEINDLCRLTSRFVVLSSRIICCFSFFSRQWVRLWCVNKSKKTVLWPHASHTTSR